LRRTLTGALALLALFSLAACGGKQVKAPAHTLEIRPNPASPAKLPSGTRIEVAALPQPAVEMQWVSGTVKLFGAPTLTFKKDLKDGLWKFRTMIPPMVDMPSGTYEIKAWGRTVGGEEIAGRMDYVVQ
jgi:hypothetical protein